MSDREPPRYEIDWLRIAGGALAAVSAAVLLSTLGAGGTLVGAALGSVIASLGTSVYAQGLAHSRERVRRAQDAAMRRVGVAQAEVRRAGRRSTDGAAEGHLEHADEQLREARAELVDAEEQVEAATAPWRERLARLNWRRVAVMAAAGFVVAAIVITVFELFAGPVSYYTGGSANRTGTTWSHIDGRHENRQPQAPTPTIAPSGGATTRGPAPASPTPTSTPTPVTGSTPSETPTPTETPSPTETPTPTDTATVSPTPTP